MKNIFYILLLLPTIIFAQYQGNANQKITLGEQTTADGLVFRGVASIDTVTATSKITRANKQDTSAYILLDTVTNLLWHYKTGSNAWTQAGGSTFDTTTLNLVSRFAAKQNNITLTTTGTSGAATLTGATLNIPQYSGGGGITDGDKGDIDVTNSGATWTIDTSAISLSGNKVTGTLPVANGGTGSSSYESGNIPFSNGTLLTSDTSLYWDNTNKRLGIGTKTPNTPLSVRGRITMFGGNDAFYFSSNGIAEDKWHFGVGGTVPSTFISITESGVATRLRIIAGGNVGISTTTPTARLQVNGSSNASEFALKINDVSNNNLLSVQNNGDVTLKNPLSVANGGTGATSIGGDNRLVYASSATQMATSSNLNIVFAGASPYLSVITGALRMRNQAQLQFWNATNGYAWSAVVQGSTWQFQDFNGNNVMQMRGIAQRVGIGYADTLSIDEKFVVNGNARITGAYDATTASAANVFVTTTGVLQRSTSSIKYKTDVEDYSKGLKEVMQLRPVTFKSINSNNDKTYAGFIAEELADMKLNELVENNDNDEPDAISYAYMVTLLTKAIQEQQQHIESLKKRLSILENK